MKLEDWLDTLHIELLIKRYPAQDNRYSAWFGVFNGEFSWETGEFKQHVGDPMLRGKYGNGKTPSEAVQNFLKEVGGMILILKPYGEDRRQHIVPKNLEYP